MQPPIRSRSSDDTRLARIGKWSGSWLRRWRSAVLPVSCNRSNASCRSSGPHQQSLSGSSIQRVTGSRSGSSSTVGPAASTWWRCSGLRVSCWSTARSRAFFLEGYEAGSTDVGKALDSFSIRAMSVDLRPAYGRVPLKPGVQYFFPRPSAGSGCKRLNLFLRWMIRRDEVDLGVWTRPSPSVLVVPLDTHVVRVGRCLGLTRRTSPGWPMAAEITASLRALDPVDPVKYDFSLCHIGMANACSFNHRQGDGHCPLAGHCAPHGRSATRSRTRSASRRPSGRR